MPVNKIISILPTHKLLKQWVAYYYIQNEFEHDFCSVYDFFPHINTTISLYQSATFTRTNNQVKIKDNASAGLLKIITQQQSIINVAQIGKIRKIGIVFYPLGINHFIQEDLHELLQNEIALFNPSNNDSWNNAFASIFAIEDTERIIEAIETFLVSIFKNKELRLLQSICEKLINADNNLPIVEIAKQHTMHIRTLNRMFKKHLCTNAETFRMTSRFRKIINEKKFFGSPDNFTQLAYQNGFSDPSYLVKTFKRLTSMTPVEFFKKVSHIGSFDTLWLIK